MVTVDKVCHCFCFWPWTHSTLSNLCRHNSHKPWSVSSKQEGKKLQLTPPSSPLPPWCPYLWGCGGHRWRAPWVGWNVSVCLADPPGKPHGTGWAAHDPDNDNEFINGLFECQHNPDKKCIYIIHSIGHRNTYSIYTQSRIKQNLAQDITTTFGISVHVSHLQSIIFH